MEQPAPTPAQLQKGSSLLTVRVEGLRSSSGSVRVALFASEAGFPGDAARAVRVRKSEIAAGRARVELAELAAGTYAVAVLHDENDNGQLDTGFLGIPSEGLGASNDAQGRFGPADWEDARFELRGERVVVVRVRYFP